MEKKAWDAGFFFRESDRIYHLNQTQLLTYFNVACDDPTFLDVGCENFEYTLKAAQKLGAKKIIAVDLKEKTIPEDSEYDIEFIKHDLNNPFPLKLETVDVVLANQILEHIFNTDNFFREIYRVLVPGGYAVVSTPNLSSLHSIPFILLGQQTPVLHHTDVQVGNFLSGTKVDQPHHIRAFNLPAIRDLGRHYGFNVERFGGYGTYFIPSMAQGLFSKVFGRYCVYVNARLNKL